MESKTSVADFTLEEKEFNRWIANHIWIKLKGHKLPDTWDDGQVESIIERYWHRAIAYSEGYKCQI